jgi:hypothetical protein
MMSLMDAGDFAKALSAESGLVFPLSIAGFVEKAGNANLIRFSPAGAYECLHWISIPVDIIDKVQPLGKRRCTDHVHDFAVLHFKRPSNPESSVYADLLQCEIFNRQAASPCGGGIPTAIASKSSRSIASDLKSTRALL